MNKFVTYTCASTAKLTAVQRNAITAFLADLPTQSYKVVADIADSSLDQPKLTEALAVVRKERATLLVADIEQLPPELLIDAIDDPKVEITAASMPDADKFQLHVYAAVASQDRAQTRENIRSALAQSGKKLGGLRESTRLRNEVMKEDARQRAQELSDLILPLRAEGYSLRAIAGALNAAGVFTPNGKPWQAVQIKRLFERLDAPAS